VCDSSLITSVLFCWLSIAFFSIYIETLQRSFGVGEKCNKLCLIRGKTSQKGKHENYILYLGTGIDIPFTGILFYVNSTLNNSVSSSNHISSLL
jgi:hypothetical protein